MRLLSLALLLTVFGVGASNAQQLNAPQINGCSFVPYEKEIVMVGAAANSISRHVLKPGTCEKFIVGNSFEDDLFFYIRAKDTRALTFLQSIDAFNSGWRGHPYWQTTTSGQAACISERFAQFKRLITPSGTCNAGEQRIGLLALNATPDEPHYIEVSDPTICDLVDFDCLKAPLLDMSYWAQGLEVALGASANTLNPPTLNFGIIPTAIGVHPEDQNGPFQQGVVVVDKYERTPLGSSIVLREGDVIHTFNKQPVYGYDDFIWRLIEHGASQGYENPYSATVERDGDLFDAHGYLFFHREAWGPIFTYSDGSCARPGRAALAAGLQEASFYTQPVLACVDYDIRSNSLRRQRQCEFKVRQLVAAYRQFCPEVSQPAAIVGSIFMPGREIAERGVRRIAFKAQSRVGIYAAATAVEGLEEVARAIITLPPGISAEDNIASIREQVLFGMSVGLGVNLVTRNFVSGGVST